jgi:hypothetical protein
MTVAPIVLRPWLSPGLPLSEVYFYSFVRILYHFSTKFDTIQAGMISLQRMIRDGEARGRPFPKGHKKSPAYAGLGFI